MSSSDTTEHTHEISDINGLETTLNSPLSSIQELILKITGVHSGLDEKVDKEHTHTKSDITDLTISDSISNVRDWFEVHILEEKFNEMS